MNSRFSLSNSLQQNTDCRSSPESLLLGTRSLSNSFKRVLFENFLSFSSCPLSFSNVVPHPVNCTTSSSKSVQCLTYKHRRAVYIYNFRIGDLTNTILYPGNPPQIQYLVDTTPGVLTLIKGILYLESLEVEGKVVHFCVLLLSPDNWSCTHEWFVV